MVNYEKLDINKNLLETCFSNLKSSILEIKSNFKEPIELEKIKGSIILGIKQVLNKFFYKENFDILDLFIEFFIKLLMFHYLINGNKRLALFF